MGVLVSFEHDNIQLLVFEIHTKLAFITPKKNMQPLKFCFNDFLEKKLIACDIISNTYLFES